jgi:tRNA(Arg) A34 adenosine deaminase TadA
MTADNNQNGTDIDIRFMKIAIEEARKGISEGETPFGSCVAKDGKLVVAAHNIKYATVDITAHAEVTAIRKACKKIGSIDLSRHTLYSTNEPCILCFSAAYWAKIKRIVYGASVEDAITAGFRDPNLPNGTLKEITSASIEICGGVMEKECRELFQEWKGRR